MSEPHPSPFPTALVPDTSFLRTIGGTETGSYQTFIQYVRTEDRELYLSSGVVEELTEQRGYISVDWVDRAGHDGMDYARWRCSTRRPGSQWTACRRNHGPSARATRRV